MDVAYDAFAESVRLIQSRHVEPVLRLSRRRRFTPMAVDVAGDVAVTLFARRGVGCVLSETWVLSKLGASWHLLGGGGGTANDDLLDPRPARLPKFLGQPAAAESGIDPRVIAIDGGGGSMTAKEVRIDGRGVVAGFDTWSYGPAPRWNRSRSTTGNSRCLGTARSFSFRPSDDHHEWSSTARVGPFSASCALSRRRSECLVGAKKAKRGSGRSPDADPSLLLGRGRI